MFEIGTSLREARLRQGLEITDAEQATKIRGKYLRALEEERFELLPAQTYVKGFLRSYADYLGLDGELYVDEYNSRYVVGEDDAPSRPRLTPSTRAQRRLEASVVLFALAGIAAAAALIVVAFRFTDDDAARDRATGGVLPRTAPVSEPRAGAPTKARWVSLDVRATAGASALAVYRGSAGGKLLRNGTLERGKRDTFVGPRLWLNVSHPENLTFRLNGKPVRVGGTGAEPAVLVATARGIAPVGD